MVPRFIAIVAVLFSAIVLPATTQSALAKDYRPVIHDDLSCLARAIYFEARGESPEGQIAVGRVILNRVKSRVYPGTICGVVYENANRMNRCQFSFACDGKPDRIDDTDNWGLILERAASLLVRTSECSEETASAGMISISMHYHATYVQPRWAKKLLQTGKIGRHIFYYEERAGTVRLATLDLGNERARANS